MQPSIKRTIFRNPIALVAGAALTAASMVPATAATAAPLPLAARTTTSTITQPLQTFAIRANADSAVGFQTLPGARCVIAGPNGQEFSFYADPSGNARFHIRPASGTNTATLSLPVQCSARGMRTTVPLAIRFDPRAAADKPPALPPNAALSAIGPRGFNPALASAAELRRFGYPPRPNVAPATRAFSSWVRAMTTPAYRTSGVVEHPDLRMIPRSNSDHWSGFEVVDPLHAKSPFYLVIGGWTVPAVSMLGYHRPGVTGYSSIWTGIDGDISLDVVQAGTTQQATTYCNFAWCFNLSSYWAWYEFYPDDPKGTLSVSPGDDIFTEVWMTTNGSGVPVGNFYIINMTTHQSSYTTEAEPSNDRLFPQFMGNSAEWILERPLVIPVFGANYYPPLPNYDWAHVSVALSERQDNEIAYYLNEANLQDEMVGYQRLSTVAPIDYESMLFSWLAYQ
jgi:hypothetical protein